MANCLNCGKEVKNKFCNLKCQHEYESKKWRKIYNENPKYCKCCGEILPGEKRRNDYCNSSCAAKINNSYKTIRLKLDIVDITQKYKSTIKVYNCSDEEFKEYIQTFTTGRDLYKKLGYSEGRCVIQKHILQRCKSLNIEPPIIEDKAVLNKTKAELFNTRKNGQSARSCIRKIADKVFKNSGKEGKCCLCNYDKHVEIAHVKSVSSFPGTTLISEINSIDNLIPLCPNHHWEFDHNCLSEENISKIDKYCGGVKRIESLE